MVNFPKAPLIRHITNKKIIIEEEFVFQCTVKGIKYEITILPGFISDGISVPRFLWRWFHPFDMPTLVAAIPHDAIYAAELFTQSECDWILLELCEKLDIGWIKRNLIWSGVKVGGRFVWYRHTKYSINKAKSYLTVKVLN